MKTIQPREDSRIQCLECSKWFRALPRHLRCAHEMDDEDYRLKFALPVGLPLVCLDWSGNQRAKNAERDCQKTLTARGPKKGYKQRGSVLLNRQADYVRLSQMGCAAAKGRDKTAKRRNLLRPYPVTVNQAAERLGCTARAAYTFLSFCVQTDRLTRSSQGIYDEAGVTAPRGNP